MSFRYWGDIVPEPSSLCTEAASSFWLIFRAFLAAIIACPSVTLGVVIGIASGWLPATVLRGTA